MDREQTGLTIEPLSKRFGASVALRDVSIEVAPGSIHAVIGPNGSGKSTLVKLLSGFHRPDEPARAHLDGIEFSVGDAAAARDAGLHFVHQDLGLVADLSGTDNILIGLECPRRRLFRRVSRRRAEEPIKRTLAEIGCDIDLRTPCSRLGRSDQTHLALARALLSAELRLLVLDEPTASLSAREVAKLFAVMRRIAGRGVAVVFISHHMDEVLEIADAVTVLRNGRRVTTRPTAGLTGDELVSLMVGSEWSAAELHRSRGNDVRVLEVRDLAAHRLHPISLDVAGGEIVGVAGLEGSGREAVAAAISAPTARAGTVRVAGRLVPQDDPRAAIRAGVVYVPGDRKTHGIVGDLSVRENLTLSDLSAHVRLGYVRRSSEDDEVGRWLTRLRVVVSSLAQPVASLSGGNQQKVMMARSMRLQPKVLVADSPTQGVDVRAREDLYRAIEQLADDGCAIVVASPDEDELVRLCDRVLVLRSGRICAEPLRGSTLTIDALGRFQLAS